jgi:hypothetical protein
VLFGGAGETVKELADGTGQSTEIKKILKEGELR